MIDHLIELIDLELETLIEESIPLYGDTMERDIQKENWWALQPFSDMRFHIDGDRQTFQRFFINYEAYMGTTQAELFFRDLQDYVASKVADKAYLWDIEVRMGQDEMNYEGREAV